MKKLYNILLLLAALIIVAVYINLDEKLAASFSGPCTEPITYKVDSISSIYDINKQELKQILGEINTAWSEPFDNPLFKQSDEGDIAINLVYGEQQQFIDKERTAAVKINAQKTSYRQKERVLEQLKRDYEELRTEYQNLIEDYKSTESNPGLQSKNTQIRRQIQQKEEDLHRLTNTLNQHIKEINSISERIETLVDDYNKKFGSLHEFNQGNYQQTAEGETINIYGYEDQKELKLVLAHEMGHALGLEHVENPESVMYYLMEDQNRDSLAFTAQDIAALQEQCKN